MLIVRYKINVHEQNMLADVTLPISSVDRITRNNIGTVKMEQLLAASTLNHWPQRIFYHPTCAINCISG